MCLKHLTQLNVQGVKNKSSYRCFKSYLSLLPFVTKCHTFFHYIQIDIQCNCSQLYSKWFSLESDSSFSPMKCSDSIRPNLWISNRVRRINPFSPGYIVKFSQLEPLLFIEQVWENFTLVCSVWSILIFSLPNLFLEVYVRRSWVFKLAGTERVKAMANSIFCNFKTLKDNQRKNGGFVNSS